MGRFALALALMTLSARSAGATPSARLVYTRSADAASCPDEVALRSAVSARFGYDPFFAWAKQTVLVEIARSARLYLARVRLQADSTTRLQLHAVSQQVWAGWCGLQTPTGASWPCGIYDCVPNWPAMGAVGVSATLSDPSGGPPEIVDFGKWFLCDQAFVCQCSATSCTVDLDTTGDVSFDMQLSGAKLDGSMSGIAAAPVHFTKAP
jgi:hypothetical protein